MPQDDTNRNRHIERMLSTELWYLQCKIRGVDNILSHSSHLISKDDSIFLSLLRNKLIKHHRLSGLLCTYDGISIFLKSADCIHGILHMFPLDTILCPESRLMNFC